MINSNSIELIQSEAHMTSSICISATGFGGVFIKNSPLLAGKTVRKVRSRQREEGQNQKDVN